jgi:hypothetical protein
MIFNFQLPSPDFCSQPCREKVIAIQSVKVPGWPGVGFTHTFYSLRHLFDLHVWRSAAVRELLANQRERSHKAEAGPRAL